LKMHPCPESWSTNLRAALAFGASTAMMILFLADVGMDVGNLLGMRMEGLGKVNLLLGSLI
jgi:hypothetical protein